MTPKLLKIWVNINVIFSLISGNNTESFDQPPPTLPGNSLASTLPLSIIAGNRPHYLFKMLRGFLATPGVNKEMVTVYIDGYFKDVAGVAELFGVKYVFHDPICSGNCRISQVCFFVVVFLTGNPKVVCMARFSMKYFSSFYCMIFS